MHGAVKVCPAATEQIAEHLSKALTHRAVDEQVEWIGDDDAAVDQQRGCMARRVAEEVHVERVFDDNEEQQHGQWDFHHQEHADDDYQHHCGSG